MLSKSPGETVEPVIAIRIGWKPWGRLAWRACLPFQGHWAWRCLMVKIRSHSIARLMINATRWIISRLSC